MLLPKPTLLPSCAVMAFVLVSIPLEAATIASASCDRAAVVASINAAGAGDTVTVPPGSCTWSAGIGLPDGKDIKIIGAGIDQTVLTCSMGCFAIQNSATIRISGFTFQEGDIKVEGPAVAGKTFRLDNNKFFSASTWRVIPITGSAPARHPTGLIDHNQFNNYGIHVIGTDMSLTDGPQQHQLWAEAPPLGSATGVVYVEDNTFVGTIHQNAIDGNYSARFVFRFNTLSGTTYTEVHSVQGANRAVQLWEFYKNTFSKPSTDWYPLAFVRGGTGVIFGNRLSATYTNDILLDNVRSCRETGTGIGKCDGSSTWDQNTAGMNGYACRDQIGRGRDSTVWAPGSPYAQALMPAYFWDNVKGSATPLSVIVSVGGVDCTGVNLTGQHVVANRDWFNHAGVFDGTTGVGLGTLANRPGTCTVGVAYWATDQGDWDKTQAGPDGQLYKCTATNTWSLYYRPLSYPHPLTALSGFPSPPANLRIIR